MSASLSFSADQLLGALERRVLGEAAPPAWFAAILDQDRALLESVTDPDALLAADGRPGAAQEQLNRAEIGHRAMARATEEGRDVANTADVAAVVLAAVRRSRASSETDEPPPEPPPPEPPPTEPPPAPQQPAPPKAPTRPKRRAPKKPPPAPPRVVTPPAVGNGPPRLFRVFVSSTFEDLEAERNVLREKVYPELARFCTARGARFQPIDLRWGVSEEASLDQQAMSICLGEIERCREVTPRPNFLVLVGNRYGWIPLPPSIPRAEFLAICDRVSDTGDRAFVEKWYQLDENSVPEPGDIPGEYRLRPRTGTWAPADHEPGPELADPTERKEEEQRRWAIVERRLGPILTAAAATLDLPPHRRGVYGVSATEQEIRSGALDDVPQDRAFCFIRSIDLTPEKPDPRDAAPTDPIRRFVDPEEAGPPGDRHRPLAELKQQLVEALPVTSYEVEWSNDDNAPSTDHLERLAADVLAALETAIDKELKRPREEVAEESDIRINPDPRLDDEGEAHRRFADERSRFFVGRQQILEEVNTYLDGSDRFPLVMHGGGGTGKSALLAEIVRRSQARRDAHLVYRFIGATPSSTGGRGLLESLCREVARRYDDDSAVPSDFQELSADFKKRLGSATADHPLVLVIDSLDQLGSGDGARRLSWIPEPLPEHVRLIVSTRPGDTLDPLRHRVEHDGGADSRFVEVGPMSRSDGDELLGRWLADAHRGLTDGQRRAVLDAFTRAGGNPLYLRLAFEEARRWISEADPEKLAVGDAGDAQSAKHVEAIIEKNTFARLADEDNHGKTLVSRALGYLAASRYGLAEDELLDLLSRDQDVYASFVLGSFHVPPDLRDHLDRYLDDDTKRDLRRHAAEREKVQRDRARARGDDEDAIRRLSETAEWIREIREGDRDEGELRDVLDKILTRTVDGPRLPVVLWSRLYADLRPYLTERISEGAILIAFYHRELDEVAESMYVSGERGRAVHSRLADYFRAKADPNGDCTWISADQSVDRRGLSELPYHLTHAARWDDVHDTLTDFGFLEQKVHEVGVTTHADRDEQTMSYRGVFELQGDFDAAIRLRSLARAATPVTAIDLGDGPAIRCPHCNRMIPWQDRYRGEVITCPLTEPDCGGSLEVASTVVGGPAPVETFEPEPEPAAPTALGLAENGLLVTGHENGHVELRTLDGSDPRRLPGAGFSPIHAVAITADGSHVATGSADGMVALWETDGWSSAGQTLFHGKISALSIGPDARVTIGLARGSLRVWDPGGTSISLDGHDEAVTAVCMLPDGTVASGSSDRRLRHWDPGTRTRLNSFTGFPTTITAIGAGRTADHLAWGCDDGRMGLWHFGTDDPPTTLTGNTYPVLAATVASHPLILAGGEDGIVRVWDLESRRVRFKHDYGTAITAGALSPRGTHGVVCNVAGDLHRFRIED